MTNFWPLNRHPNDFRLIQRLSGLASTEVGPSLTHSLYPSGPIIRPKGIGYADRSGLQSIIRRIRTKTHVRKHPTEHECNEHDCRFPRSVSVGIRGPRAQVRPGCVVWIPFGNSDSTIWLYLYPYIWILVYSDTSIATYCDIKLWQYMPI